MTTWMEGNIINTGSMSIIVLEKSFGPDIKYFYFSIITCSGEIGAVWVEFYWVDDTFMVSEFEDVFLGFGVPEIYYFIIASRSYQPRIRTKIPSPHPILMLQQRVLKPLIQHIPHLHGFIIRCRQEKSSIAWKINTPNWCGVCFQCWGMTFDVIFPESDCFVFGAWCD